MRAAAVLLFIALGAGTQASAQQGNLELIRDSLRAHSDVSRLREREYALASRGAVDMNARMERALVLMRIYELTEENRRADEAREIFEDVVDKEPQNAWAHYGLGLALAGGPGVRVPSPGGVLDGFVLGQSIAEIFGQDPRSLASRHFLRALELNPNLSNAALEFSRIAMQTRHKDMLTKGRDLIRRIQADGARDPNLSLALSNIEAALGNVEAAEAAANAALAGSAGSATAMHARAVALLRQDGREEAGTEALFAAIDSGDATALVAVFEDVRPVASEAEMAAWEAGDLEERRRILKQFWDLRAAAAGVTVPERIAEHYRRVAEAQARFRRTGKRGAAPGGSMIAAKYDVEALPFDERGLIYVRHGEPEEIIRASSVDLRPNETWVYLTPAGKYQLFHFVVLRDGTDYRLVDYLFNAVDASSNNMPYDGMMRLLETRGAYDQRYNIMAQRLSSVRNRSWFANAMATWAAMGGGGDGGGAMNAEAQSMLSSITDMRIRMSSELREAAFAALETDSDRPDFDASLPFYYDLYTFRGADGDADVTAAIAVPATHLSPRDAGGQFIYSVGISLIVIDTIQKTVTRSDTVLNLRSQRRLGAGEHVRLHASLDAAPTLNSMYRLIVRDMAADARGQLYGGPAPAVSFTKPGLMISDLVLAEPGTGSWTRGNVSLALVPPRQFREGEPLNLFYELYNLPAGAQYRTEIVLAPAQTSALSRIRKLFGGSGGTIRLNFDGTADPDSRTGAVQELREVTAALKPGRYKLSVTVTNVQTEETASAEKVFLVLPYKGR